MRKLLRIISFMFRVSIIVLSMLYAFHMGSLFEKNKRQAHPKWGTNVIHNDVKKRELGPVFYSEKQCLIVIKALSERDGKTRRCINLVE